MKNTKKFLTAASALLALILMITGCGNNAESKFDGCDEINAAKKLYESLDSAHVVVTDNITGLITQDFTFMYDDTDTLNYSYRGTDGSTVFYEFNNGGEIDYCYDSDNAWSTIAKESEDFYTYTRTNKHSFATEAIISLNESSITSTTTANNADGSKTVTIVYDVEKLNTNAGSQMDAIGSFADFSAEVTLNAEGYVTVLHQWGEVVGDGANTELDYTTSFTELNNVSVVERPVAEWEK